MTAAFRDTSSLFPLCVRQHPSSAVERFTRNHSIVVWWGTSVEIRSGVERLLRIGQLTGPEYANAGVRIEFLRRSWRELQPSETIRTRAEDLLAAHPLKAADALQLAAAVVWASGAPHTRTFLCGDAQLLTAARQLGFQAIAT